MKTPYNRRIGSICDKHPDLKGLRHLNFACVDCQRENTRRYQQKQTKLYREQSAALGKPVINTTMVPPHHYGKVCDKHPELKGARRKNYVCIGCQSDYQARWKAMHRVTYLKNAKRAAKLRRAKMVKVAEQYQRKFGEK